MTNSDAGGIPARGDQHVGREEEPMRAGRVFHRRGIGWLTFQTTPADQKFTYNRFPIRAAGSRFHQRRLESRMEPRWQGNLLHRAGPGDDGRGGPEERWWSGNRHAEVLFDSRMATNPTIGSFDVDKDGRFLVPVQQRAGPAPPPLIINWQAGLKK